MFHYRNYSLFSMTWSFSNLKAMCAIIVIFIVTNGNHISSSSLIVGRCQVGSHRTHLQFCLLIAIRWEVWLHLFESVEIHANCVESIWSCHCHVWTHHKNIASLSLNWTDAGQGAHGRYIWFMAFRSVVRLSSPSTLSQLVSLSCRVEQARATKPVWIDKPSNNILTEDDVIWFWWR